MSDNSPAVETPLDKSAVQIFTSYKFKLKYLLNLLRNSSLTINVFTPLIAKKD